MKKQRKSRVWQVIRSIVGKGRECFAASATGRFLECAYASSERSFRQGRLGSAKEGKRWRAVRSFWMRNAENSFCRRISERTVGGLLASPVSAVGCLCIVMLPSAVAVRLLLERSLGAGLILPFASAFASLPLLLSRRSVGEVLRRSRLLGWVLFDFFGFSVPLSPLEDKAHLNRRYAGLIGCGIGAFFGVFSSLTVVLAFFGALAAIMLWMVPECAMILLVLLLPFLNFLPHPTLCLLLWVGLIDLSWLTKVLVGRRSIRLGLIDPAVLLLLILYAVSGVLGYGGWNGVYAGGAMALLCGIWFPTVGLLGDSVRRRQMVAASVFSATLCALIGIGEYTLGKAELRWVDTERFSDIGGRVCASFSNPNLLAVFLLLIFPLALANAFCTDKRRDAWLYGAASAVIALCLLLTWSRGAWLGCLVSVLLVVLLSGDHTRAGGALALPPILTAVLFLPHSITNRFLSIASLSESSIRYRLYTWQGLFSMLRNHWWGIGVGQAAFVRCYAQYAVSGTESVMHSHQLFFQVLLELGMPGALLFVSILCLLALCGSAGLFRLKGRERGEVLGALAAVAGVLVMGLFDYVWYHYGNLLLFWLVAATVTLPTTEDGEEAIYSDAGN